MTLAAALDALKAAARCPLCRGPLRAPLTLSCGHNCCGACLQRRWEQLREPLPCPVCGRPCPRRPLGSNTQLGLLAELVAQLPGPGPEGRAQEPRGRCGAHGQALSLFCEDDLELLCGQCGAEAAHAGHRVTPVGPAAAQQRRKLKARLGPLREQLREAERGLEREMTRAREWRDRMERRRAELLLEAEHMKRFLNIQYEVLDGAARRQLASASRKLSWGRHLLWDHRAMLQTALWQLTRLSLQSDQDLLAGFGQAWGQWAQRGCSQLPAAPSFQHTEPGLVLPPHYPGLHNLMDKFWVDLTLDPESAHLCLSVSPDRKTVRCARGDSDTASGPAAKAFVFHEAVVAVEAFEGGRHFWQVDIRGSGMWALGVCRESFPRDASVTATPDNGCWQLQQFTDLHLDPHPARSRVGVFLDYELGELSFYSLDTRAHLHTLGGTFDGRLQPYFRLGSSSSEFSMTLVSSEC